MKRKTILIIVITSILCCFKISYSAAQYGFIQAFIFDAVAQTDPGVTGLPPIQAVGIGDFWGTGYNPLSALHINTNILPASNVFQPGEVFRSDCPFDYSSFWRMFKGSQEYTVEYGRLHSYSISEDFTNYPNTQTYEGFHFTLQSSFAQRDPDNLIFGDLRFNTPGLDPTVYNGDYPRMRILGGEFGFVGIGDYNTFLPKSRLHLHEDDLRGTPLDVYEQFTNINTGTNADNGLKIGIHYNAGGGFNYSEAEIRQQEIAPIIFYSRSANLNAGIHPVYERMRITERAQQRYNSTTTIQATGVTISRGPADYAINSLTIYSNPIAMFNIGNNSNASNSVWYGNRPWMDVGTYNNFSSDNMYIGLKDEGPESGAEREIDAVVNWGDNFSTHSNTESIQNLRFIFTAPGVPANTYTNGPHKSFHGLEVARMCGNGNVGIGDFYNGGPTTSVIEPVAKLEILDARDITSNYPNTSLSRPHLRLTFTQAGLTPTAGIWTDFRTTSLGDLLIHPFGVLSSTDANPRDRKVGINIATPFVPGNTLEITSSTDVTISPRPAGLRFTNLTSSIIPVTPVIPNPFIAAYGSPCMLSVDDYGDVILVKGGEGDVKACTGGITAGNVNFITKITAADEICNSAFWENYALDVGIGITTVSPSLGAQLQVECSNNNTSILGINTSTPTGIAPLVGVKGQSNASTSNESFGGHFDAKGSSFLNAGVDAFVDYITGGYNYGGFFYAKGSSTRNFGLHANAIHNSTDNIGGDFMAVNGSNSNYGIFAQSGLTTAGPLPLSNVNIGGGFTASNSGNTNIGIDVASGTYANAVFSNANIGGRFEAGGGTSFNYGVFVTSSTYCTGTSTALCPQAAGFFNGDVATTGLFVSSDSILKTNVQDFTNGLSIINQLQPKTYNYDTAQFPYMHLHGDMQYGLIAQHLIPLLPQALKTLGIPEEIDTVGNVKHSEVKYLGINYPMLIPILIAGMKEQQQQINDLQTQIINCCGAPRLHSPNVGNNDKTSAIKVKLMNSENSILYQNEPNPFSSSSTIRYFIPENTSNIKITFQDATGKTLKEVEVNQTGQGSIVVDGSELINGIYTYSLVIGNKAVDTKKMVKQ